MNTQPTALSNFLDQLFAGFFKKPMSTSFINPSSTSTVPNLARKNVVTPLVQQSQTIKPNQPVLNTTRKPPIAQPTPQNPTVVQVNQVAKSLSAIRNTQAFIENAPKLFDSGSAALLTASAAVSILKAAGVPVPKDVQLSVAACQAIASGGVVVDNINKGASFGAIAAPSAAMIDAIAHVGQMAGLLQINNEQMLSIDVATDAIMVIAAGGYNVLADLKLIFDSYSLIAGAQGSLQSGVNQTAQALLNSEVRADVALQQYNLGNNLKMLAKGELDIFHFASQIAGQSALYFNNVFPQIGVMFPPVAYDTLTAWASASNWLGQNARAEVSQTILSDVGGTQKQFFSKWGDIFIEPILEPYNRVLEEDLQTTDSQGRKISNRISLNSLAIMSLLPGSFQNLDPNIDIRPYLLKWNLTPYDFPYDDCITSEVMNMTSDWFQSPVENVMPLPISFNGVESFDPNLVHAKELADLRYQFRQTAMDANRNGDIKTLLSDDKCSELVKLWGQIRDFGPSTFQKINGVVTRVSLTGQTFLEIPEVSGSVINAQLRVRNKLMNGEWRNIKNYISALSVMKFLAGTDDTYEGYFAEKYPQILLNYRDLSAVYSQIIQKSTYRQLNNLALQNIASLMNTTVDKLDFVNKNNLVPDGPGLFRVKG